MKIHSAISFIAVTFLLTACTGTGTPRPRTESRIVNTPYIMKARAAVDEVKTVVKGETLLKREIYMSSLATVDEDVGLDPSRPKLKFHKGTTLFAITENPIFHSTNLPKSYYCGLNNRGLTSKDIFTMGLGFGLLTSKIKVARCLEDTDNDGNFDKVWKANLNMSSPPSITNISQPSTLSTPVAYTLIEGDNLPAMGTLWLTSKGGGFTGKHHTFTVKLGSPKKFVELNGNEIMISNKNLHERKSFFGANFEIVSYEKGVYKIRVIDTGEKFNLNLNRTFVHY